MDNDLQSKDRLLEGRPRGFSPIPSLLKRYELGMALGLQGPGLGQPRSDPSLREVTPNPTHDHFKIPKKPLTYPFPALF